MTKLEIAAVYAGINILILLVLAARISARRGRTHILIGDGGDGELLRLVRAHGNAAEFIPAGLLGLLFLALLDPAPAWLLQAAGIALTVGRLAHAYGLSRNEGISAPRGIGAVLTLLSLLLSGVGVIWAALAPML